MSRVQIPSLTPLKPQVSGLPPDHWPHRPAKMSDSGSEVGLILRCARPLNAGPPGSGSRVTVCGRGSGSLPAVTPLPELRAPLLQIEQQLPQLPGRAVPPERGLIVGGFDFPDVEASGTLVKETLDLGLVTAEQ